MSIESISYLSKLKNIKATIGVFDGVHLGHQKILKKLVKEAAKKKTKSLAITFYPHPRSVLSSTSKVKFLMSLDHRIDLMKEMGVDFILIIKFTKKFSKVKPEIFIKEILVKKLRIDTLIVGKNFLFGRKGEGDFSLLKRSGMSYGFKVTGIEPVKKKNIFISSTRIRSAIEKGDLKKASFMLGRPVMILGTVVGGRRVGRKIGFPTANINPHHEAIPPSGVYAVDVRFKKDKYKGVLNIGRRPTFGKDQEPSIELHILNFKKDIYGKDIEIMFKRKIRNEKKFTSVEKLRIEIQKDILKAS